MAVFAVFFSYAIYILVSFATCKKPFNMDKLLHRGVYAVEKAAIEKEATKNNSIPKFIRWIGITNEFTRSDTVIYITMIIWTVGWSLTFIIGTIYNLTLREITSEEWTFWWAIMLGIHNRFRWKCHLVYHWRRKRYLYLFRKTCPYRNRCE